MIAGSYNPRLCERSARGLCETISAQTSVDPGMRARLRGCGSTIETPAEPGLRAAEKCPLVDGLLRRVPT
jgi:hypothetical protein